MIVIYNPPQKVKFVLKKYPKDVKQLLVSLLSLLSNSIRKASLFDNRKKIFLLVLFFTNIFID